MANKKISTLTASTTYSLGDSYLLIVDEADTTQALTGSNYKVSVSQLLSDAAGDASSFAYTNTTATYTVLGTDMIVGVNHAAAVTITLPNAASYEGKKITIKDEAGDASNNTITVDTDGGTIDGDTSIDIVVNYTSITVYSNGTNWFLI